MAVTPMRGPGIGLPLAPGLYTPYTGPVFGNEIALQAGMDYHIPAGQWLVTPGPYTFIQFKDPLTTLWRTIPNAGNAPTPITSDGVNFRLINLTGFCIGAVVTNAGTGYTSTPSVTISTTGATCTPIMGGAISTTITVGTAGAGYNYPPLVLIGPPPIGAGVQATAYATLTTGTIGSITVVDQGAGYTAAPPVYIIPDPRDTGPTTAAAATTALVASGSAGGAQTLAAVIINPNGATAVTAAPTFTVSGGGGSSAAVSPVMCGALTGATQTVAGVGYTNSSAFQVRTFGGLYAGAAAAVKNPSISTGLFVPRQGSLVGAASGAGALGTTQLNAASIVDAGLVQAIPSAVVDSAGAVAPSTIAQVAATVGGSPVDVSLIQPC